MRILLSMLLAVLVLATNSPAQSPGDELVNEYFRLETRELTQHCLTEVETLADWQTQRPIYRQQLLEMLGLDPLPEKTDLKPVITGTIESDEVVVERLHFQSRPGLYVTGNLYRPKNQTDPLPAILYVCGHGRVKKNGVSFGNKTHYQHHGAWFARNGYICLTIDTIQLGEIEGIHHGTYREKMWWWNNRGYTPAGVEAWNCVRALDYLQSRDEVDGDRIGVTGRSGGGAYSWWIAAIDERIKVAVPVAGITSLHNHVVDGCIEGHCDCMFMVNTYQWDYPAIAALVAPRPLLISNTDKDRIFPLEGVVDVHAKVRRIYEMHDAKSKLGLQITEGPHRDTQELRIHAFRWFNRFLKQDEDLITTVATPLFTPEQLKVFDQLPADESVTQVHESFVPQVNTDALPTSPKELSAQARAWKTALREHCFRGWPSTPVPLDVQVSTDGPVEIVQYTSQLPYLLQMLVVESPKGESDNSVTCRVLDHRTWLELAPAFVAAAPSLAKSWQGSGVTADMEAWQKWYASLDGTTLLIMPRGVGPTAWSDDERTSTHIRRRFMQLGQTAATMQIFDVRRALQAMDEIPKLRDRSRTLQANDDAAVWALHASVHEPRIGKLKLNGLPIRNRKAPDILNVSRFAQIPHLVLLASQTVPQIVLTDAKNHSEWQQALKEHELLQNRVTLE